MSGFPWPDHLLTVEEFLALPETGNRIELVEGTLVLSPRPTRDHSDACLELGIQLKAQLPAHLKVYQEIDIDLSLAPAAKPGFVRSPDLLVVDRDRDKQSKAAGRILRASDLLLAVEIVSPGSRRADYRTKRDEYAEAGIPNYWVVDVWEPATLTAYHPVDDTTYAEGVEHKGVFKTEFPFPFELDLATLEDR
ncbi:Uma2 family endonuclease [Pseudonocardiaceae bacterium YIM PH 21723]|nr:Uma2 family endonuclease [Pseudonocardiaceae bacterium YIM PH 21723]